MARKRIYNTVRTDTLESYISYYESIGEFGAVRALMRLASEIAAPIDKEKIAQEANKRRQLYEQTRN